MLTGQLLAPDTIRRIVSDATKIPVVLGTDSEVLDVGRERRLFTPGCSGRCGCATAAEPSRDATRPRRGPTLTTSFTGPTEARRACSAGATPRTPPAPSRRWGDPQLSHQRGWTATATTSEVTWHL